MKLDLVLASESPRRKTLLEEAGFSFHVFPVKVSENLEKNLTVDEQIVQIARTKAQAAHQIYKPLKSGPYLILAADTMVVVGQTPLGKPMNSTQACEFLRLLSGRSHEVKTALFLLMSQNEAARPQELTALETTKVFFRSLSEKEISDYVATGEPLDKAGAYGIQGLAGKFVEKIEGSLDNVIGLPVQTLKALLLEKNWKIS